MQHPTLSATVIICAYTERRWDDIVAAIASLRVKTVPPVQILVVVDDNDTLRDRLTRHAPDLKIVDSSGVPGLADARNTGVALATGDVVAFLDDDAVAAPDWLEHMLTAYLDGTVLGVGGRVEPAWDQGHPGSLPPEFWWVVGCSYRGLPESTAAIRNPIGAGMSLRRDVLALAGGFSTDLGRVLKDPAGCEETELCIRAAARVPGGRFLYEPRAIVHHRVPAERVAWSYFRSRCYGEGRSKALVTALVGSGAALAAERSYVARVLPRGFCQGLGDAIAGDLSGFVRATRIVAGLSFTTAGYASGRWAAARASRRTAPKRAPSLP